MPVFASLICHRLGAAGGVPVDQVQLQIVRLAVAEVDVHFEARAGVPAGGDAAGAAGVPQAAGVGGARGPRPARLAGGGDGGVARQGGRVADDVVALRCRRFLSSYPLSSRPA